MFIKVGVGWLGTAPLSLSLSLWGEGGRGKAATNEFKEKVADVFFNRND